MTLHRRQPLRRAVNHEGADVTAALQTADRVMVSPTKLRTKQLRGLAEPHSVTLDFGPLDPARPLVLALTGWLRFGGGMANIGAAHTPDLPFPFPTLETEAAEIVAVGDINRRRERRAAAIDVAVTIVHAEIIVMAMLLAQLRKGLRALRDSRAIAHDGQLGQGL